MISIISNNIFAALNAGKYPQKASVRGFLKNIKAIRFAISFHSLDGMACQSLFNVSDWFFKKILRGLVAYLLAPGRLYFK